MKQEDLLKTLKNCPFVLAPMAAITDCAFRSFMKEMGSEIVVSELVSAKGLEYSGEKTLKLMRFDKIQCPVGIQLFGEDPSSLGEACKYIEQAGADFVDLNLGCPVPKVVKKGAGSALLKDLDQLERILKTMVAASSLPVTIKIRTGWDAHTRNADRVVHLAAQLGITWVAVHGRTRAQGYEGLADWGYLKEVKESASIPIIGNGDILSAESAMSKLTDSKCDGVMIGRGALKNPWIFREARQLLEGSLAKPIERDIVEIIQRLAYWYSKYESEERIISLQIRKFAAWFSSGYPGSAQFRKSLFQAQNLEETLLIVSDYFGPLKSAIQSDTGHERFLMGGHG